MTATDADSHAVCYRMLEELMQDTEVVVTDLKRHGIKQSCGGGSVLSVVPSAAPLDGCLSPQEDEQVVTNGGKCGSSGSVDDGGSSSTDEASDVIAVARRGSPVSCCCGDNRGFNVRDNQRDDMTGIMVANGGRFPCLHIGLTGLRHNRRYFLALDFVEVGGGGGDGVPLYCYTEPYFTPRPNNLSGMQWMGSVLYFNLNSIANGGLQESGTTLKVGGEYEPTLRLLELRDDQWPSGNSAVRFPLRGTAFLVVSLSSEVRMNRTALASEFLLVRKSEMSRGRFPAQQQPQPPQPQQQECCRTSPPTRSYLEPTPMTPTTPQSDWRRLLELRVGSHQAAAAAAAASRLMRTGPAHHGLQALPAASDPLSVAGGNAPSSLRPVYASAKTVVHDHFSGGVWKSLPPQPQPSHQPAQPPPQQQPVGSWHSSARQPHSCLAPGAHLELGALLHQNREVRDLIIAGASQRRRRHLPAQAPAVRLCRRPGQRRASRRGAPAFAAAVRGRLVGSRGRRGRARPPGVLDARQRAERGDPAAAVSPQLRPAALQLPPLARARQEQRGQAAGRRLVRPRPRPAVAAAASPTAAGQARHGRADRDDDDHYHHRQQQLPQCGGAVSGRGRARRRGPERGALCGAACSRHCVVLQHAAWRSLLRVCRRSVDAVKHVSPLVLRTYLRESIYIYLYNYTVRVQQSRVYVRSSD
ncbi:uncharacterized protein [Dermacentor albipictus]|uniref:uncharacterized protein isoform X1 n=1 Tax=Dermacentor albipictus TaxID=60249 RepID=UPI0031FC641C